MLIAYCIEVTNNNLNDGVSHLTAACRRLAAINTLGCSVGV